MNHSKDKATDTCVEATAVSREVSKFKVSPRRGFWHKVKSYAHLGFSFFTTIITWLFAKRNLNPFPRSFDKVCIFLINFFLDPWLKKNARFSNSGVFPLYSDILLDKSHFICSRFNSSVIASFCYFCSSLAQPMTPAWRDLNNTILQRKVASPFYSTFKQTFCYKDSFYLCPFNLVEMEWSETAIWHTTLYHGLVAKCGSTQKMCSNSFLIYQSFG